MHEDAKPRGKVRDREDAIANTPEACATQLRAVAGTREFFASSRISNPNLALRRQGRGCGVGRGRGVGGGLGVGVTTGVGVGVGVVGVAVGVGVGVAPQGLTGQLKISIVAMMVAPSLA